MQTLLIAGGWFCATLAVVLIVARVSSERRNRDRLLEKQVEWKEEEVEPGKLTRWLMLAGYRSGNAASNFVIATLLFGALGGLISWGMNSSGIFADALDSVTGIPGGLGDLSMPILVAAPWLIAVMLLLTPWSIVRSKRRKIVESVEREMPLSLELLATMSESGLGFDGSLASVLETESELTPLREELRMFQMEALGGVPRVQCFRRLSKRLEVPSVSMFVSALVHAERLGAGISSVLRTQADELRRRRRERANTMAQALPVKLVFPLILCFMPGLFVTTLGPAFLQFIKMADGLSQG